MLLGSVTSLATAGAPAWDSIVGECFIAILGAPADPRALEALAEAAGDPRASLERLVSIIPAPLDDPGGSFALAWWSGTDPGTVTAVVRGDAVIDLDSPGGSRRFDGRGLRPWHLAEFHDVTGIRLTAAGAPLARLGGGAVVAHARASLRASAIEWHRVEDAQGELLAHEAETVSARHPAADVDTVLAVTADAASGPPSGSNPVVEGGAALDDPARAVPSVRIAGGATFTPAGPVFIGRRPAAPRIAPADGPVPRLVQVESPRRVVSSTHLELRVEGGRLVASDLRSTNGTIVFGRNGTRRLRAGESIVVVPGMRLDLGDDTIVEILRPPGVDPTPRADSRPNT
ncbi:FHA domain-containing protein [Agromyces italicus]|uniref:FHA domain-containing protein n=1 Tax=Agromyces italicus TaxID=279572 RepID=UPI00146E246B|nr:FHA domain-containing protein [Agromyces italicus]